MSYYYNYFIGYKDTDGLYYPLGPYDNHGKLHDAFYRSRSFASDLHHDFWVVPEDKMSDQLRQEFKYKDWNGENKIQPVKYLALKDLPKGDYIRTGYFLIEDVRQYKENGDDWDLFYDYLTPEAYAARLTTEAKLGPPPAKKDEDGYEWQPHSVGDYMYYAYPDYHGEEYEAFLLRQFAATYEYQVPDGAEIVILETEG